ncbi:MAG: B3/4 domain-containing protein [Magnetovibrionaceae bacterium]
MMPPDAPRTITIQPLLDRFPNFRVSVVVGVDLVCPSSAPAALDDWIEETVAGALARDGGRALAEIPEIRDWREAYKAFGVKQTRYRCSVERLIKSIAAGKGLARILPLVDLYNAISVRHIVPVGADDLDQVAGNMAFRFAKPGDSFQRLGSAPGEEDPPKEGEVVLADAQKVLCRRWNWSQDRRSALGAATRACVITLQSLGQGDADAAGAELEARLIDLCGGRVDRFSLSANNPIEELPTP